MSYLATMWHAEIAPAISESCHCRTRAVDRGAQADLRTPDAPLFGAHRALRHPAALHHHADTRPGAGAGETGGRGDRGRQVPGPLHGIPWGAKDLVDTAGAYDLVLVDCQMPELDGYAASRETRSRERSGRRVTVIAMTADAMGDSRELCIAAGMDDYISKLVKRDQMSEPLRKWLVPGGTEDESCGLPAGITVAPPG